MHPLTIASPFSSKGPIYKQAIDLPQLERSQGHLLPRRSPHYYSPGGCRLRTHEWTRARSDAIVTSYSFLLTYLPFSGVHTWSHPALTTLTNEQIVAELGWTRKAIKDVTGVTPILFRPPYGDIDDRVRAIAKAMNLVPALWTSIPDDNGDGVVEQWDSNDWRVHGGTVPAVSNQATFNTILEKSQNLTSGIVVLQHDIYNVSVDLAIGTTIPYALAHNPPFKMESVQVCQGDPIGNAYIETTLKALPNGHNTNSTVSGSSTTAKSPTVTESSTTTSNAIAPAKTGGAGRVNPSAPLVTLGLGALILASLLL